MDDSKKFESALKHYQSVKRASAKYYETHKDEISERRKQAYRSKNPVSAPRGRPRKNMNIENKDNAV
jgi:hypothetical protein